MCKELYARHVEIAGGSAGVSVAVSLPPPAEANEAVPEGRVFCQLGLHNSSRARFPIRGPGMARGEVTPMNPRSIAAGVSGGVLAIAGPAVVHAFTDDPMDQLVLSLIIAGAVIVTVLILGLRSKE
ncbi:MAG TPA: hypothetical protein VF637_03060 [Sphingomicrobium sp.]